MSGQAGMIPIDELYKEVLLDHYSDPRNADALQRPTVKVEGHNPVCGDEIKLSLQISEQGIIKEVCACTQGCCISVASGSMMAVELKGKSIEDAEKMIQSFRLMMSGDEVLESESGDFEALSGVKKFPVRIKCALLAWVALEQAIQETKGFSKKSVTTEGAE
jgi:nitrogen fixation protein NifU and related proteins